MEHLRPLRLSLVAVWLITGVVSLIELHGQSADLLKSAGLSNTFWIDTLVWGGAGLDFLLGFALWWAPRKSVYGIAMASMCLMTLIATLLTPSLWLHPLGPLLKNIPIAAMLYVFIRAENHELLSPAQIRSHPFIRGSGGYRFWIGLLPVFSNRTRSVEVKAEVSRLCVRADWWFTTPTVIIQPVTGFAMVYLAHFPLTTPWIALSLALYVFAGICWLPVVWLQVQMAKMAQTAHAHGTPLPDRYEPYRRWWEGLGYPAFVSMVGVFYLMVAKPELWG